MSGKFWSPLLLSGVAGPFTTQGMSLTVNPRSLLNPNRGPMLIDQFRFSGDGGALNTNQFAVEIRLGAVPLMPRPVTLSALCPRYLAASEALAVWHLPKPLFVPPGVQLTAKLTTPRLYNGLSSDPAISNVSVRMTVAGRSLAEDEAIPKSIAVPWVTETRTQVTGTKFVSPGVDLINAHDVPLYVSQFVSARDTVLTTRSEMTVEMTASDGSPIVRGQTPYQLLFPTDRGLLEMSAVLQPGQFINVILDHPVGSSGTAGQLDCQFTTIGMHGYRMVPTPTIGG